MYSTKHSHRRSEVLFRVREGGGVRGGEGEEGEGVLRGGVERGEEGESVCE